MTPAQRHHYTVRSAVRAAGKTLIDPASTDDHEAARQTLLAALARRGRTNAHIAARALLAYRDFEEQRI